MQKQYLIRPVAKIYTDFPSKFGIPRQSGLVEDLFGEIVFEEEFRDENALKGIEEYSHLWLLWIFSENERSGFSPTVRPPRLGGNKRMGVFATRSPFRPNGIGLSCVRLIKKEKREGKGTVLIVSGADLMNGTPIIDVKPYLPYVDDKPGALGGFSDDVKDYRLNVIFPENLKGILSEEKERGLLSVLSEDPRPSYQADPNRIYGMDFSSYNVKFSVEGEDLKVIEIKKNKAL